MKQRYFYVIGIAAAVALLAALMLTVRRKREMENRWKDAVGNVKAYSSKFSSSESQNRVFRLTIDQLKCSNDSIFKELNDARKELGVKDSKLKSLQYVSSSFSKSDTILLTDTLLYSPKVNVDTVLSDEWYSIRVGLQYPSTVMVQPQFASRKHIVVSTKKETVNPPQKFFLFRWFQKKHTVVNVDVVERNPYMQNQNSRFVEIVK